MNKVIFWHNFLTNNWKELISEQFKTLYQSGLYDVADKVCCGVVGTEENIKEYQEFIPKLILSFSTTNKIEIRTSTENNFEYITLNWLKEYCDANDAYVSYIHTKGISQSAGSFGRLCKDDHRKYMEYFCIEKWKDCTDKLDDGYDCCGPLYWGRRRNSVQNSFFVGNFFWCQSCYVKRLPILIKKCEVKEELCKRAHNKMTTYTRVYYEKWLLDFTLKPKIYNFGMNGRSFSTKERHSPETYREKL